MSDSSVLSLLVWATLLPLIVVLVLRTSKRDDEDEGGSENGAGDGPEVTDPDPPSGDVSRDDAPR